MARPQQIAVAAVVRGQLGLVEALDDRVDGRVHEADVGVHVPIAQLPDSGVVRTREIGDDRGLSRGDRRRDEGSAEQHRQDCGHAEHSWLRSRDVPHFRPGAGIGRSFQLLLG